MAARSTAGTPGTPGTGTGDDEPDTTPQDDDLEVTLDLLAEDQQLREALREPSTVRLTTRAVITIPHSGDWTTLASRFAAMENWLGWASEVLTEDDFKAWQAAKVRNYQMKRIIDTISAADGTSPGKRQQSSRPRAGTRGR